jgi:hypothetical protein
MAVMVAGTQFWLWRAVDDEGEVLDRRSDGRAAELEGAVNFKPRWRLAISGTLRLGERGAFGGI